MEEKIGIIGGSGITKIFKKFNKIIHLKTPFGISQPLALTKINNKEIIFTNRHSLPGSSNFEHALPPHLINYKAMIYSLAKLGVKRILAINSVGSLDYNKKIGGFFLPTQFIDFTKRREYTFYDVRYHGYDEILSDTTKVKHIDVTEPFCKELLNLIYSEGKKLKFQIYYGGCYICTEGPRLETPAEINFFKIIKCDVVGMTLVPEIILAREINLCYASISIITNYAAGMQEKISLDEVKNVYKKVEKNLTTLLKNVIKNIEKEKKCNC